MFNAGSIKGDIFLNGKPAKEAEDDVLRHTKGFTAGMDKELKDSAAAGEKSYKDALKGIKGELGKNSALGQTLKLAMGGGAIAGFSMAGNELAGFVDGIREVSKASREAGDDWGTFLGKIGTTLPGVGGFWKAGQSIREMFTGEQAAIDAVNEEAQRMNNYWAKQVELAGKFHDAMKRLKGLAQTSADQAAMAGSSPFERSMGNENIAHREKLLTIEQARDDALRELRAKKANEEKNFPQAEEYKRLQGKMEEFENIRLNTEAGGKNLVAAMIKVKTNWGSKEAFAKDLVETFTELKSIDESEKARLSALSQRYGQKEASVRQKYNETLANENSRHTREDGYINKQAQESYDAILQGNSHAASELQGQTSVERLRSGGHDWAAEEEALRWHAQDEIQSLRKATTKQIEAMTGFLDPAKIKALWETVDTRISAINDKFSADLESQRSAFARKYETPGEKFQRDSRELTDLHTAGVLDDRMYMRALAMAQGDYAKSQQTPFAEAIQAGSYTAFQTQYRADQESGFKSLLEVMRESRDAIKDLDRTVRQLQDAMPQVVGSGGAL